MKLGLLRIGTPDAGLLKALVADLQQAFQIASVLLPDSLDPSPAYHWERQQYHSSELLHQMQSFASGPYSHLLAITDKDLYIPILTFVFGEAQMGGPCAIVSTNRLRQEFYGLPADENLLRQRLVKESFHELGHTLNLVHCDDYSCVMASSHSVEWIDLKSSKLCASCQAQMLANADK
jgi:archaemetzincin